MKRRAQGKTRTGAIPACMEPASTPYRARVLRAATSILRYLQERPRAVVAAPVASGTWFVSNSGLGLPYYDSVALFAESHPPAGDA